MLFLARHHSDAEEKVRHFNRSFSDAARPLFAERRSSVSVLFATAIIPIIGLCGLAVDYALYSQIDTNLNKAMNVAALNAVKIAVNGYLNGDPNYLTEGQNGGSQWAAASGLPLSTNLVGGTLAVNVSGTTTITGVASYSNAKVTSIFGRLFGIGSYNINASATSTINTAPYLEVVMMIDNSSSMDIGATNADIQALEELSPCDPNMAFTGTVPTDATWTNQPSSSSYWYNAAVQDYSEYSCNGYHGVPACPVVAPTANQSLPTSNGTTTSQYDPPPNVTAYGNGMFQPPTSKSVYAQVPVAANTSKGKPDPANSQNPFCSNNLNKVTQSDSSQIYPITGMPCAFACHWSTAAYTDPKTNKPDGTTADLYGMARRHGIALRIDEVKNAAYFTLQQMAQDNLMVGPNGNQTPNLSVGIYTFNTGVTQVYPDPTSCTRQAFGCEAASNWPAAEALVGLPPQLPSVTDTGITPHKAQLNDGPNNDDTAWPEAANALAANYVTAAGDGNTPTTPRKVLFLITDGFEDDPNTGARHAFDYDPYCTQFKNMNYQVYVVYTPYYPLMHSAYLQNWTGIVEGSDSTTGTLGYNLIQCSSQGLNNGGTYYISAQDQTTLTTALAAFLKQALNNPARYTH